MKQDGLREDEKKKEQKKKSVHKRRKNSTQAESENNDDNDDEEEEEEEGMERPKEESSQQTHKHKTNEGRRGEHKRRSKAQSRECRVINSMYCLPPFLFHLLAFSLLSRLYLKRHPRRTRTDWLASNTLSTFPFPFSS